MASPVPENSRPPVRLRRSPLWLAAGILLACLGGLLSAFVYLSLVSSDPVLRVNRTIHRGELISAQDLSVIAVGTGLDARTVPEARLGDVVGRAATTDLPAGGLLVDGTWSEHAQTEGTSRVGVRLEPGRFPAGDLRPGTPLLVVALPDDAVADPAASLPSSVRATLVAAPATQADGSSTFDLYVGAAQAESVARLSALQRVVLVQEAG